MADCYMSILKLNYMQEKRCDLIFKFNLQQLFREMNCLFRKYLG